MSASASMRTILVIGGTNGIGLEVARRFHQQGKKLIITGRPGTSRLADVEKQLTGVNTYGLDVSNLAGLAGHIDTLFTKYPDIDTVWANAGNMTFSNIKDPATSSDQAYIDEINLNISAPLIVARHVIPRLIKTNKEANFLITSSGLGFVPVGSLAPVYNATKAAVHSYMVGIRQVLKDTNVNVIELVPPFVEGTNLGSEEGKARTKGMKGMTLDEYVNETFEQLDNKPGKELKEVGVGSAAGRVEAWRNGIGQILVSTGLGG